jgi:hypothetical protein
MKKAQKILTNSIPVLIMIALIPLIKNDYILTVIYIVIIVYFLKLIKATKNEIMILYFGFIVMIIFEYIFISTGVETFTRNSLFGVMPIWLPFLWAYGFVMISRSVKILDTK